MEMMSNCLEVGDDDVLIRVRATGVNNTDLNTRIRWCSESVRSETNAVNKEAQKLSSSHHAIWSGIPVVFPRIQGADVCGHIVDVGSNVSRGRIWRDSACALYDAIP